MARVSIDEGQTWNEFPILVTNPNLPNVEGAFNYADRMGGGVIIELLGDASLNQPFSFTGMEEGSSLHLTLRSANPTADNPTLTKAHADGSMITFAPIAGGSLTVQNVNFNGGGIFGCAEADGGIFNISSNTASPSATFANCYFGFFATIGYGGAIYATSSSLSLTDCSFYGMINPLDEKPIELPISAGGAICYENSNGTLTMTNCNILHLNCVGSNGSGSTGGGIFVDGTATLSNVYIADCSAYEGSAIYSLSEPDEYALTLKNGTRITGNHAIKSAEPIYNPLTQTTILPSAGSAVYMSGILTLGAAGIDEETITINGNYATGSGGRPANLRLCTTNGVGLKLLSQLTGEICIANPGGNGAQFGVEPNNIVSHPATPASVFKSDITNRDAYSIVGGEANTFYWRSYVCKITDANGNLLGLYSSLSAAVSAFTSVSGAANIEMLVEEHSLTAGITVPADMTLKTATKMWGPDTYGFPADSDEDCATIKRGYTGTSLFTLNIGGRTFTLENITLDGNRSNNNCNSYGGLVQATSGTLNIRGCTLQNSITNQGGGAVCFSDGGKLNLENTSITNCKADGDGGGLNVYGGSGTSAITFDGITIKDCSVTGPYSQGGGIWLSTRTLTLNNVQTIENCSAHYRGGGLYFYNNNYNSNNPCTLKGFYIKDCKAEYNHGGGMYLASTCTVESCTITGCKAPYTTGCGGGIYVDTYNSCALTLVDCNILNNMAKNSGGGIFADRLTLQGSTRVEGNSIDNTTVANGGGVYVTDVNGNSSPSCKLYIGTASKSTNSVTIMGNTTSDGKQSNLRLPMVYYNNNTGNQSSWSSSIYVNNEMNGSIGVCNPGAKDTQLGSQTSANLNDPSGLAHIFSDINDLEAHTKDNTSSGQKQIVWRNLPVCKITDSNGNLLTYDSFGNAVFYSLREAFEALGSASFSDTPAYVKMLRDYAMKKQVSINASMPYDITLTTAGTNSETEGDYRYTGTGTRATLYKGSVSTTEWMFSILGTGASGHSFTLDNITIDGSASNDFTWGGMLSVSNARFVIGNATLQNIKHKGQAFDHGTWTETNNGYSPIHCVSSNVTITNGALFDNLKSTSSYGALYLGSSTLTMTGGTFQNCSTTGIGGAIYCNSTLNITGGEITGCSASRGGAIYCDAGSTLNLNGGEITGCSTTGDGGGIYMANHRDSYQSYLLSTLNVSGLVKVYGNTKGAAKDGAANNVFLDKLGKVNITDELACGSSIGITTEETFSNDNYGSQRVFFATGSEANCLDAFRKGYFFEDSQNYKPYCFNYGSGDYVYSSDKIYLVKSWYNLADENGISVDGNTITVNTAAGLAYIAKQVNEGNDYQGKTILLNSDLNLGNGTDGKLWIPIGNIWEGCTEEGNDNDAIKPFRGTFDGQGHTITGLTSYLPHKTMGLFGVVGASGEVKNVFIEGGTINATYVPEADESAYVGGLVGMLAGGTVAYSESAATLASNVGDVAMGGLVGTVINSGTIHSSMAMPSMTISSMTGNIQVGGLVGDNGGHVANSFANASIAVTGDVVETGGLVGLNTGTIDNCYARLRGTAPTNFGWIAGTNSGTISNSYIPYVEGAEAPTGCSYYTPTNLNNNKYGFGSKGQEVGSSTLVDLLNTNATGTYAKWTRTMASPINGDYPVLKLGDNICLGSKANSNFIGYGSNLNNMIAAYNNNNSNGGGNIYLYDVPEEVTTNTSSNVRVYIPEDFGILQGDGNTLNARAGVTVRNASGNAKEGASASWHMFSAAVNAPLGIVYHTNEDTDYMSAVASQTSLPHSTWSDRVQFDPPKTTWSTSNIGYFPTDTPYGTWRDEPATTGFFDLYAYSEENYHWMNLKREGTSTLSDHWHTDRDDSGNHQKISYTNGTTMPAGKGYLLAISDESMLMADGVLNNGTKTVTVTKSEPSANVPSTRYTPDESKFRSINLVGNPYQSYLDFDAFATENTMLENMYATRSGGEYIYYTADASANGEYTASQYVHPHQGFFVRVSDEQATGSYTVTFDNNMRLAGTSEQYSSPYRGQVNYPLVNLLCYDAEGHRDLTTVEVNRPEQGGGHKMEGLRTAEGTLAAQLGTELFQTAFVPEGTNEVPVRFEAYEDGQYTMRWNTLHGEFSYLHLIDNMTGADVDCLAAEEYTFNGKTTDYTSRFKLVFSASQDEDENDDDEAFAFFNGSEWVITNGNGATVQLVDVLGRVLRSEAVNGNARLNVNAAPGVYVLRLISGESVKTQKIVIR